MVLLTNNFTVRSILIMNVASAEIPLDAPDGRMVRPDEAAAAAELSRFVRHWLSALPAADAQLLWQRHDGLTVREIAERLSTSRSAVHRQLQRLESRLVEELEAHGWRPPRGE